MFSYAMTVGRILTFPQIRVFQQNRHIVLGQLLEMPAPKQSFMVNGVQAGVTGSNGR